MAKVHVLELWNNNKQQLEDNMLKSDTSLGATGRISLKNRNCSIIEISDSHTGMRKHTIIGKFTMKKPLTSYNLLN